MTPTRRKRLVWVIVVMLMAIVAVFLINYAFKQNIDLFYSTSQIKNGEAPANKRIRVGGLVVDNSVSRDNETLEVSFDVTDELTTITVSFEGILPDLFREGQGIVARGQLQPDGSFIADEVLAKHDETYMPPEVAASLAGSGDDAYDTQQAAQSLVPTAGGN